MSNKGKKILLLGGSYAQIPAIKAAKKRDLYILLCDYLSDNPGQEFADEYINASTTDKERILKIAKEHHIDFILSYASDPAAPTAAYVSEKLGLPGNSYESVKNLSEKHLFRKLLRESGLNCPKIITLTKQEVKKTEELEIDYPLIIKPVDSSGSKGVRLIDDFSEFYEAAEYALSFSRSKRVIIEEYITAEGNQLHGDGFVFNGVLAYCYLGDHHYNNKVNSFVPYSTTWPSAKSNLDLERIYNDLNILIKESGLKNGPVNIEARITEDDEIYIMEVGPRSGGNFVPQVLKYASDFDMIEAGLNVAMGIPNKMPVYNKECAAYYVIHTDKEGTLSNIIVSSDIEPYMKEYHQYVQTEEKVHSFQGANAAIGILLMTFPNKEEMHYTLTHMDQYISIEVS